MEVLVGTLDVEDLDGLVEELGAIGERHGVTIQAFDARYVAGRRHLERAVTLADRAIERDENVAHDRAVEILLYAAGRRQIDRALEMGVSAGETDAVVMVDGPGDERSAVDALETELDELERVPANASLSTGDADSLVAFFGVTDEERRATDASLEALVCERVALLDVEK